MITVVVGKEIEKIKGDFESYLNGLNMVGEISYSQYSELYDEGTKQIQKAYELGKSELEKEVKEWKDKADLWCKTANLKDHNIMINKELEKENAELKEKYDTYLRENTGLKIHSAYVEKKLTEAKEIIRTFLNMPMPNNEEVFADVGVFLTEAEQFLNSEVEK